MNNPLNNGSKDPFTLQKQRFQTKEEVFGIDDVKENMYTIPIKCDNCGNEKYFTIPKGCAFRSYLKNEDCLFCNCKIVRQRITKK